MSSIVFFFWSIFSPIHNMNANATPINNILKSLNNNAKNVDVTQAIWNDRHCLHSNASNWNIFHFANLNFVSVNRYPNPYPVNTDNTNIKNLTANIINSILPFFI